MKRQITIGIPKNTRLRQEIQPILSQSLSLTQSAPGMLISPYIEDAKFVELKITDLIKYLKNRFLDLVLISDAGGLDNVSMDLDQERNTDNSDRIERCFGLKIENPAVLRTLVREEDRERMIARLLQDRRVRKPMYETAVSTYPFLMSYYFGKRFNKDISTGDIWQINGQVESFMRNGVIPKVNFAYDIVSTGETARKFGLETVDTCDEKADKGFRVYPSLWRKEKLLPYQEDTIGKILPQIRGKIMDVIETDDRNAIETLRA